MALLDTQQVTISLNELNQQNAKPWSVIDGKLHKQFQFSNFIAAFEFMSQIAVQAEKINHHPDWCNAYNRVTVNLVTHEAGGLTSKDFELASFMESAWSEFND